MNKVTSKTKTALVTGANRGIGYAIAKGLSSKDNIRVLATSRKAENAEDAAGRIGSGAMAVTLDLSGPADAAVQVLSYWSSWAVILRIRPPAPPSVVFSGSKVIVPRMNRPAMAVLLVDAYVPAKD